MIKFENPKNGRFYYLYTQFDMFSDLVLVIIRGGTRIRNSRIVRTFGHGCERIIQMEIERIIKIRKKNGYIEKT